MFKLPKSVYLMGKTIKIERAPLKKAFGMFYNNEMRIVIATDCPEALIEDTLFHELTHAVLEISGLTNAIELPMEEAICRAMENMTAVYKLRATK